MKNGPPAIQPENRETVFLPFPARKGAAPVFLVLVFLFAACVNQNKKIVFHPEPPPEQGRFSEPLDILESQNAGMPLPEWVEAFLGGGIEAVEGMAQYQDSYVFIGKNRGANFKALQQWANVFSPVQDFPRLAVARIERRMLAAASLYPDDEYGDYFAALIKDASDAEYPQAVKGDIFWIKQRIETGGSEEIQLEEVYEFLVLISIDKTLLQSRVRELMAKAKPAIPPTRAQSAAINRVQQSFFEGF
jgi:hypothetical protein